MATKKEVEERLNRIDVTGIPPDAYVEGPVDTGAHPPSTGMRYETEDGSLVEMFTDDELDRLERGEDIEP
jgi:hypothetical protein